MTIFQADYDTNNRSCCTGVLFGWKEQENGDRVFAPVKAAQIRYFVIAAAVIYLIWIIVAHCTVSNVETLLVNYAVGFGVLVWIVITGFLARMTFNPDKPVFTLRSDKTLVLHRLHKTVVPDETTYYELNQRPGDSPVDLYLFHQGKSYYLFCEGEGDVHQVGKELTELLPCDEATKENCLAKITEFRQGQVSWFGWILIILGGSFAACHIIALLESSPRRVPEIIAMTVFLLIGIAVLLGGLYMIKKGLVP